MRTSTFALMLLAASVQAESIEVYREKIVLVTKHDQSKHGEERPVWSVKGELVGEVDLGESTLDGIVREYRRGSWKDEPFYGPVERFVLLDSKGRAYVAHLEYVKGDKRFGNGERVAINRLEKIRGKKDQFKGSAYDGSSVRDERLLAGLRRLVGG